MGWIEYWNDKPTIYVSPHHRDAHYRSIAAGIVGRIGDRRPVVLDFGCGEALHAADVARRSHRLYLCDAAPNVRAELLRRFAANGAIAVVSPDDLAGLSGGSLDLIIANSVIQYLTVAELDASLGTWRRLLSPEGELLIADVIPPSVGPLTDALALLDFARQEGFFIAALAGLVRTFFSDYRRVRAALGLRQFSEDGLLALLRARGFEAQRVWPNLGHNQSRMAFLARRRDQIGAGKP